MADLTPQAFVERWERVTLSERSSYQQHFLDLCDMLDEPKPAASDDEGTSYTFEKRVEKTGSGTGFADVWRRGRFAIEYKKKGGNLEAAYAQLAGYREGLELPPVMIATDIARFLVSTNFTGQSPEKFEFTNRELLKPRYRDLLKKAFSDPEALREVQSPARITEQAAAGFARLADGMRERGVEPHRAAHFLNRLLFCLFAEDVRLLPENAFSRVVERGAGRPESFNRNIGDLFRAMASGGEFLLHDIRRFNGGLFEEADDEDGVVELTAEELRGFPGRPRSTGGRWSRRSSAPSSSGRWTLRRGRSSGPTTRAGRTSWRSWSRSSWRPCVASGRKYAAELMMRAKR